MRRSTEGFGTRHHSVYSLCNAIPEIIGMVVSQDGNVQIIKKRDSLVTCWDQAATNVMAERDCPRMVSLGRISAFAVPTIFRSRNRSSPPSCVPRFCMNRGEIVRPRFGARLK